MSCVTNIRRHKTKSPCMSKPPRLLLLTAALFSCTLLLLLCGSGVALAIPSPELVVGSFTSISQLFAIGSALIGGGAAAVSYRMRGRSGPQMASRNLMLGAAATFALLIVSVGFNVYLYVSHSNARQASLEQTLLRPAHTPGGLPVDSEIQELSYADQLKSPLGLSTAEVERIIKSNETGKASGLLLLDIRETAEAEMGSLPGVRHVRFPDLASSGLDFSGKRAIFFCHNGNRSSEACLTLAKKGVDCRFMTGGFEKWVVEGRPMTGLKGRGAEQLRAIPAYPNETVLLDTAQVKRMAAEDGAIFVDARYPGEFNLQHLPDAINIPLRRTPTAELQRLIGEVPRRPIILPCYDRRSCFMTEVLGLELYRAGHDVRGRYTQPWLYYTPKPRPPHVEQRLAEMNKSYWRKGVERLAAELTATEAVIGLVPAILLLALLSRILVLPFSLKSERDQIRSRAASDEFASIKERFRDDPQRLSTETRAFYKRHGLTPMRNLIALFFLPVMALGVSSVQSVTEGRGALGWLPDLGGRDPYFILPMAFSALITLYLDMAFGETLRRRALIWLIGLPLFTATGALFAAGPDIYLVCSAALIVIQRLYVSAAIPRWISGRRRRRLGEDVIPFDEPERLAGYGAKAHRLALMRSAGMPVPDGVLLTPQFLETFAGLPAKDRARRLKRIWRRAGARKAAVRSCARAEDGSAQSFAGVFESELNVERDGLEAAIARVQASYETARAASYGADGGEGGVLIQRMVEARYSGVLFTRDPSAGALMMVELVEGTAESLVSGAARPQTFRFGRTSGKQYDGGKPPIDLTPLLALGRKAQDLFGRPQDMEWTWRGGSFFLVQSRDVTRALANGDEAAQDDLARAADLARAQHPDAADSTRIVYAKNELSEMMPRPTLLSLSLMEELWARGGSVDQAARSLGFSYRPSQDAPYLVTVLGRLYVNKREEEARSFSIGGLAASRLQRNAETIERNFREHFLPRFLAETRIGETANFQQLSLAELTEEVRRLKHKLVYETHVEVDAINIAANFHLARARAGLTAKGLDASVYLGHIPETAESRALARAASAPEGQRLKMLSRSVGHRATHDYELAEPRLWENARALMAAASARSRLPGAAAPDDEALDKSLRKCVEIARRFETLKEDAKHHSLRELAVLRRALLTLDNKLRLNGQIFHLSFDELLAEEPVGERAEELRGLAAARSAQAERLREAAPLPSAVSLLDIETASWGNGGPQTGAEGEIRGSRVSGSSTACGWARVVSERDAEDGAEIEGFEDGDIIVAPMISPAWLPYFSRAGGFVSELGGWLSHTAILAREHDAPMVVGVDGLKRIPDGALVELHLDGRIEVLEDTAQPMDRRRDKSLTAAA
jgi:rhodanese-related sulfurtransferase/membrane protein insertase Oxa1/YidC/SpoIIIJ/phosphohistidine swiveling domain-containing protein